MIALADHLSPETFLFGGQPVRVLTIDGDPWFIAKEVCDVLGISKYRDAVARLDDDEGRPVWVDTLGGRQQMTAISESGLYTLVLRSDKPEAKAFRKWVTSTVLPAIRKTGSYVRGEEALNPNAPDYLERLKDLLIAAQERKLEAAEAQLAFQAPKVAAQERLAASAGSMSISDAARRLGMSQSRLFTWMQDHRWIFRSRDKARRPVPYADKREQGLMEVSTSVQHLLGHGDVSSQTALVTPKGLAKLAEMFGVPGWDA